MIESELLQILKNGESSTVEFKTETVHPMSLAEEVVAFANFEGGTVFIGVGDDGTIAGCARSDLDEFIVNICRNNVRPSILPRIEKISTSRGIVFAVIIPRGESAYATSRGMYFIRVGSTRQHPTQQELVRLFQHRKMLQFDETPVLSETASSIDAHLIDQYLAKIGQSPLGALEFIVQELCAMSVLVDIDGIVYPTLAGLLVFGRRPQVAFPSFVIRCGAYRGSDTTTETIAEKTIAGALPQQIDDAVTFCKLVINQTVVLSDGVHRSDIYDYPLPALREAIVNAVCHRDYTISGSAVRINVFCDRVEIRSPGRLPNTLTLQSIRYRQFTRNQAIASFLSGAGFMEQRGKGILRLEKLSKEAGLTCTFTLTPDENEFVVTMSKGM